MIFEGKTMKSLGFIPFALIALSGGLADFN
jgi:hypothetical protein